MKTLLLLLTFSAAAAAQSPRSILLADTLPGADIGAKINAAFAASAGTAAAPARSALVELTPGKVYLYTTTIVLPNETSAPYITAPVLDCHNAELRWTGAAMAQFTVLGGEGSKSGEIRNCHFSSSNLESTIVFWSRNDFAVNRSYFGVPVRFLNDTAHGGKGFAEDNHWDDIELDIRAGQCGISFEQDPSLTSAGSFFYNWFTRIHLTLNGNARGFCLRSFPSAQPQIQGGSFDVHVNASRNAANSIFYLEPGTSIIRGVVEINGEHEPGGAPTYDVYAAASNSLFYNFGSSNGPFDHGYGAGVPLSNITFIGPQIISDDLGSAGHATRTLSSEPGGTIAQRLCENLQVGNTTAFLLAAYGAENDCFWQVAYRSTDDANPDVDRAGSSHNPITSRIWTSSQTGVGVGPNYGVGKSNIQPAPGIALESSGGFGLTTPTPLGLGVRFQQTIDPATGTLRDFFSGGARSGQPGFLWREDLFDPTDAQVHTGLTRFAAGGAIHYSLPTLRLGTGPELTSIHGTGNTLSTTAGAFTPGDPVTTDSRGNLVDAGTAFTGTKQAGPCTFTIVKGLITNVTGC